MSKHEITLVINGEPRTAYVDARLTLVDFIREECGLTGTHIGCEHGACGACTVLLEGVSVRSCLMFACQVGPDQEVVTVEGLQEPNGELTTVQQSFRDEFALQCGFCTSGFVVAVTELLRDNESPDDADVIDALGGNLCRCTGYQGIRRAVARATGARSNEVRP